MLEVDLQPYRSSFLTVAGPLAVTVTPYHCLPEGNVLVFVGALLPVGYRPSFLASWFSKQFFYNGGWRVIHLYVVH